MVLVCCCWDKLLLFVFAATKMFVSQDNRLDYKLYHMYHTDHPDTMGLTRCYSVYVLLCQVKIYIHIIGAAAPGWLRTRHTSIIQSYCCRARPRKRLVVLKNGATFRYCSCEIDVLFGISQSISRVVSRSRSRESLLSIFGLATTNAVPITTAAKRT